MVSIPHIGMLKLHTYRHHLILVVLVLKILLDVYLSGLVLVRVCATEPQFLVESLVPVISLVGMVLAILALALG